MKPIQILLSILIFSILLSISVNAQYLTENSSKIPLNFMSSQYWQNNYSEENDSLVIDASHWYLRIPHKFGIGLMLGGLGALAGTGLGAIITPNSWGGFVLFAPIGYTILSAVGVKAVSSHYGQIAPYLILLLGGIGGFASGIGLGELLQEVIKNDHTIIPHLFSIIAMTLIGEITLSELEYNTEYNTEWDEYIYNKTDKLVFHEYVKSTQVFNFELLRIQL